MYVLDNTCSIIYLRSNDIRITSLENVYGVKYYCLSYNFCFLHLTSFDSTVINMLQKQNLYTCNIRTWGASTVI